MSEEQKEKIRQSNLGKKHKWTKESLLKFKEAKSGKSSWNKGKKLSKEHADKTRFNRLGKKMPDGFADMMREKMLGANNPNWKGGINSYERKLWHNRNRRALLLAADGYHSESEWQTLKAQYNWTCPMCCISEPVITLTADHVIPLSKGGSNNIENIQPLCRRCNSRKNNKITIRVVLIKGKNKPLI